MGRHYTRQYMQDFGSVLGSGSMSAQQPRGGYEYLVETAKGGKGLASLDFTSAIGSLKTLRLATSRPRFPRRERPSTRIVHTMINAIVEESRLSDSTATGHLADCDDQTARQDCAMGDHTHEPAGSVRNPLGPDAGPWVRQRRGAAACRGAAYRTVHRPVGPRQPLGTTQSIQSEIETASTVATIPSGIWGPPDDAGLRYAVAVISTRHPQFTHWMSPVVVTLRNRDGALDVVGIARPTDLPSMNVSN
jgi:hypothetical protein